MPTNSRHTGAARGDRRAAGRGRANIEQINQQLQGQTPAITSGRPVERIGDGGPVPIVEIRNSFQDENPALVSLQFYWPD